MNSVLFLVPIILSLHISLGLCFEPVCLNAPVTHYGLSQRIFLLNRTNNDFSLLHISIQSGFRPVHSQIRQSLFGHSDHRYFIDSRPVGNAVRLRTGFVAFALRLLSAVFTELLTVWISSFTASRSIRVSVSGRYSFIPLIGSPVLPIQNFFSSFFY